MNQTHTPASKSIFITGCSSGIGRAIALHLARKGFIVFASVRKPADAEALRAEGLPDLIPVCPLDLTHLEHIPPVVEQVRAELERRGQPGLYALINNAGGGSVAPVELMDLTSFSTELQTRLVGATALVQALLPLIRAGQGRIVWIATPATIPTPYVTSIHACDFAVNCLARTLDIELKRWGIPSIQVRCGGIKTAKGNQTTAETLAVMQHPHAELYRGALQTWMKDMAEFDEKRTEPEKVAQVVEAALRAAHPRSRYSIGHMAGLAAVLESLPQPLADRILKMRF